MTSHSTSSSAAIIARTKAAMNADESTATPNAANRPADAHTDADSGFHPLPLGNRILNLIMILLPFVALIVGIVYAWGWGIGWVELGLLTVMYLLTGFGVTIGYHRLFTHKSFKTGPIMTATLGILGSMAAEGPILNWVAFHRCHHQHSDSDHDPHSPHGHGTGAWGVIKGFWNAHVGWMIIHSHRGLDHYVKDLQKSKLIVTISRLFPLWFFLSLIIPAVIGGLISMTWTGALLGFLWGGLIRVLIVHHITWSVNSVCHLWGSRPFKSHDESRNNLIVGILALGEGWHNNHHAFPTSARHGLRWWQIDFSYVVIWIMAKLGLAWDVYIPDSNRMKAKQAA